jgi:hypothetical protein
MFGWKSITPNKHEIEAFHIRGMAELYNQGFNLSIFLSLIEFQIHLISARLNLELMKL